MAIFSFLDQPDAFVTTAQFEMIKGWIMVIAIIIALVIILLDSRKKHPKKGLALRLRESAVAGSMIAGVLAVFCLGWVAFGLWWVVLTKAIRAIWYVMTELTGLCIILGVYALSIEIRLRRLDRGRKDEGKS